MVLIEMKEKEIPFLGIERWEVRCPDTDYAEAYLTKRQDVYYVSSGTTRGAIQAIKDIQDRIGKPIAVSHCRAEGVWTTTFLGKDGIAVEQGGLGSGYGGEGPRGLHKILKELGFPITKEAEQLIFQANKVPRETCWIITKPK